MKKYFSISLSIFLKCNECYFQHGISVQVRSLIETLICKKVTEFINEDFNEKLLQTQTKTPLANAVRISALAAIAGLPNSKELMAAFQAFNISIRNSLFEVSFHLKIIKTFPPFIC